MGSEWRLSSTVVMRKFEGAEFFSMNEFYQCMWFSFIKVQSVQNWNERKINLEVILNVCLKIYLYIPSFSHRNWETKAALRWFRFFVQPADWMKENDPIHTFEVESPTLNYCFLMAGRLTHRQNTLISTASYNWQSWLNCIYLTGWLYISQSVDRFLYNHCLHTWI